MMAQVHPERLAPQIVPERSNCTCSYSAQLSPHIRQETACGSQVRWVDVVVQHSCPQLVEPEEHSCAFETHHVEHIFLPSDHRD